MKNEIMQMLSDFSKQDGDTYEQRSIIDSDFDQLADEIIKKINVNANNILDEAVNGLDWSSCYDSGCHCDTDSYCKSILSLKSKL